MAMVAMRRQHQKGARPEACSGTDGGDTEAAATIATHQISTMSVSEVRSSTHHCAKKMVPLIFDSSSA
jgi:hypothetical protein